MAALRRPLSVALEVSDARIFLSDAQEIFAVSAAGLLGVILSCVCVLIFELKIFPSAECQFFLAHAENLACALGSCVCARIFDTKTSSSSEREIFAATAAWLVCSTLVYVCSEAFAFSYWGSRPGGAFGITKGVKHAAVEATQNVSH